MSFTGHQHELVEFGRNFVRGRILMTVISINIHPLFSCLQVSGHVDYHTCCVAVVCAQVSFEYSAANLCDRLESLDLCCVFSEEMRVSHGTEWRHE